MRTLEIWLNNLFKTKFVQAAVRFFSFYSEKKLGEYAAQASYYLILSVFPFIMLLLTLIHFLPIEYEDIVSYVFTLIPTDSQSTVKSVLDELFIRTNMRHTLVTAVITLWASSKSVSSLMRGLNNMYECRETRFFVSVKINALINTLLLGLVMLGSMLLMVFGDQLAGLAEKYVPDIAIIIDSVLDMRTLFFFCIVIFINMLMYQMLPNRRVSILWQLPGALFCTLGWYLFTVLFQVYMQHASNYYIMYGSLTAIIFAIIWVYACILIFYIGAGLNLYCERYFYGDKAGTGIKEG